MQLTKGQKDALVRKALDIVNKKREEKRAELVNKWKPSAEVKKLITAIQDIQNQVDKIRDTFKKAGFRKEYNSWSTTVDGHTLCISAYDMETYNSDNIINRLQSGLKDKYVEDELQKYITFPDFCEITDEIELLNLSKTFDIDEFLAKYQNL